MINFFSNLFGYVLNIIYELVNNYGFAIIIFSILLKLLLLPLTIKQQRTLKKSQKIQGELKIIQERYKNDQEKLNQEVMALYKREKMNPFSGCFSSIAQLILLLAMFYLVRSPLTYMKKIDSNVINDYKEKIALELGENGVSTAYPEISIVKYVNNVLNKEDKKIENIIVEEETVDEEIEEENKEEIDTEILENAEETTENDENEENDLNKDLYINMNFLGLDLSNIPKENFNDIKVFIIPVLYIISSIISIKLTQKQTAQPVKEKVEENNEEKALEKNEQEEMSAQMSKSMTFMMPILAVSVSVIAPLGLALYWLVNNVLMIAERIIIDKIILPREEDKND